MADLSLPFDHVDLIVKDGFATPGKRFGGRSYWWQARQILEASCAESMSIRLHPHPWPVVGGRVVIGKITEAEEENST